MSHFSYLCMLVVIFRHVYYTLKLNAVFSCELCVSSKVCVLRTCTSTQNLQGSKPLTERDSCEVIRLVIHLKGFLKH